MISPAVRGRRAERATAVLLRLRGFRVLARNLRIRGAGEVDVLARSGSTLVLVEVKARRRGEPAEAVGPERQRSLRRCAEVLLAEPGERLGRWRAVRRRRRDRRPLPPSARRVLTRDFAPSPHVAHYPRFGR